MNYQITSEWTSVAGLTQLAIGATFSISNRGRLGDMVEVVFSDTQPLVSDRGQVIDQINRTFTISGQTQDAWVRLIRFYQKEGILPAPANNTCLIIIYDKSYITESGGIPQDLIFGDVYGERSLLVGDGSSSATGFNSDDVMLGNVPGSYIVEKFGRNSDVDTNTTPEDVWNGGGVYTGFTDDPAEEFEVVSDNANDITGGTGANTLRLYYYDDNYNWVDDNGDYLFVDVPMNGETPVLSGVTGMRMWRAKAVLSGSNRVSLGEITVRWVTSGRIFAVLPAGFSQTQICAFTIPAGHTGYIKQFHAEADDQNSNRIQMAIRVSDYGSNTDRLVRPFLITDERDKDKSFFGGLQIDEKSDFAMNVQSMTSSNATITASMSILVVKNIA